MAYDQIVKDLGTDGEGVFKYDQSVDAGKHSGYGSFKPALVLGEGICRGLVTEWLKCKKADKPFASDSPEALLEKYKTVASGFAEQAAYDAGIADEITYQSLAKDGMELTKGECMESAVLGFAENSRGIGLRVLGTGSRYFILSLLGHSFGMFRPWSWWGKSSTIHIFDPNEGEFKVTGLDGVQKALNALRKHAYPNSYSKGFYLHAFKG